MTAKKETPHINVDYFENLTGDIPDADTGATEDIGTRLKELRKAKGLSLQQLADLTGVELTLLEEIEGGEAQPQLGTVLRLSKTLESAFGGLVTGSGDRDYVITRKTDRPVVARSTSKNGQKQVYQYYGLAAPVRGRHMEPLIVRLNENPAGDLSIHEGEEFIYVLEGMVSLDMGDQHYDLEPGDSAFYLSSSPHLIAAKSGTATILAVIHDG